MIALLLVLATLAVGFFNGANDISKAIATLVGSGVSRYRTAVVWGSIWTFAGAATAAIAAQGLVAAFSGKGILYLPPSGDTFLLSVAMGALAWLGFATRCGLPVSTTHALVGALIGTGVAANGWAGINPAAVLNTFALPLALGPVLATLLVLLVFPLVHRGLSRWQGYCVCVQQPAAAASLGQSAMALAAPAEFVVDATETCAASPVTVAGVTVADGLHWLSAGATASARGLNDAPKVLGLGIAAAASLSLPLPVAFLGVAGIMTAGCLLRGMKVTDTLACKITRMNPLEGLAANLVTTGLVISASHLALPVSTTHVSSGAIIGLGLKRDARGLQWHTVREMALAWLVTLPIAGAIGATAFLVFRSIP